MRKTAILIMVFATFVFVHSMEAQTWNPAKRVSWSPNLTYWPAIATDSSNNIYIVRSDGDPESMNEDIILNKSTDGGATWPGKRVTWTANGSRYPAIAIDSSNNIHVLWEGSNYEIYYKRSTDGGSTWSTKRLSWTAALSRRPAIDVDSSDNIHVVWSDKIYGNNEIFYRNSTDGGSTWTGTLSVTSNSGSSDTPKITTDPSNNIHIVWADNTPGNYEIYYRKSTDGGMTWPLEKRLTWNASWSQSPSIATDSSNNVHVVWSNGTSNYLQIFYRKSTDGGNTWQLSEKRTKTPSDSHRPVIAVDSSNNIHLVWDRELIPFSDQHEVFYMRKTDGMSSWPTAAKRLTWAHSDISPDIAIDSSSAIHVTWWNNAWDNDRIYYRKGVQ